MPDATLTDLLADYDGQPVTTIQPHGVLLVLQPSQLTILQVSANSEAILGIPAADLVNRPLTHLLPEPAVTALVAELPTLSQRPQHRSLALTTPEGEGHFDALLHRRNGAIILELEPTSTQASPSPGLDWSLSSRVRTALDRLQAAPDLDSFLQQSVNAVRGLLGFDRVHILRFEHNGAGSVIVDARAGELPSFVGQHFPSTDIPALTRDLYRQGLVRFVGNVEAAAIELVPAMQLESKQTPDLSFAALRGVDPCCITYHQNMGVAAFWAFPLRLQGELWGLISGHNIHPKPVPYSLRAACEVIGQFVAAELGQRLKQAELAAVERLRRLHADFLASIAAAEDFRAALLYPQPRLLDLVNSTGVAVCLDGEIHLVGKTPTAQQVQDLLDWVAPQCRDSLFVTHTLSRDYPPAREFAAVASGMLVLKISYVRRYYLVWFRPEVLQTITWIGNPEDAWHTDPEGIVSLCPRASFTQWQETMALTSLPWQAAEQESALALRNAIVGVVLNKADELAEINQELERRNRELDSFAFAASHDLQEPLRGIHNYSTLLLKGYGEVLDEVARKRLETVIRLTRRTESLIEALLRFSRLGQAELHCQPSDLNQLLELAVEAVHSSRPEAQLDLHIPRPLPTVNCDPVLITEVLTNLFSNACKYTNQQPAWVKVGYHREAEQITVYVQDRGIGIRPRHLDTIFRLFKRLHEQELYGGGTGVGLPLARRMVERHGGRMWVESTYGEGSTFYFTLKPG